jgi:hypothetical protein
MKRAYPNFISTPASSQSTRFGALRRLAF